MPTVYHNKNTVRLTNSNYLAGGGQGQVYVKGGTAYKLYTKSSDMIPESKVQALSKISSPNVLNPKDLLTNKRGTPLGFTMDFISGTVPLGKLFTSGYRKRNGITETAAVLLAERMAKSVENIHSHDILMVDGNEYNYLVSGNHVYPYFIDVDSYQTPQHKATVIMPSIRDWHTQGFDRGSDWFSFAIVAFQLLVGVHPYKGTHPNYKKNDFESRMKDNVSVLNPDVKLSPAARDLSVIPSGYMDWFERLFIKQERCAPPTIAGKVAVVPKTIVKMGSDSFDVSIVHEFRDDLLGCEYQNGNFIAYFKDAVYLNRQTLNVPENAGILNGPDNAPICAHTSKNTLRISNVYTGEMLTTAPMGAERMFITDGRVYAWSDGKLTEMKIQKLGNRVIASPGASWTMLPNSSTQLRGMYHVDVLGKTHLYVPYQSGSCAVLAVSELDAYKVLDGKHDNGVIMLMAFKNGQYDRITLRMDDQFNKYSCEIDENVTQASVNFVTMDTGVIIQLTGEGSIELSKRANQKKKVFLNAGITGTLFKDRGALYCYEDNKVFRVTMKK
jgi:hypothetical protein